MTEDNAAQKMAERFIQVTSELKIESDRGVVIVAVAWIEDDLTRLLKAFLLPTLRIREKEDELFGIQGCLGMFSAKIDLAYRLGLIREKICRSLHLCRRIRNEFAHQFSQVQFEQQSVKDRVLELFRLNENMIDAIWEESKTVIPKDMIEAFPNEIISSRALLSLIGARSLFEILAGTICSGLLLTIDEVKPIQPLE